MSYTREAARKEFESWSRSYDDSILQRLLFTPSHNCILERLTGIDRPRVLDIGCGTGAFAARVLAANPNAEVCGLDLTRGMLRLGTKRLHRLNNRASLVQGDSERLPLGDCSFDVVTCSNSFHHYPNQRQAVCEMYRVLRPEGQLMIVDGFRDNWWGRIIYDVCVVAVEGRVHHASARRFRELFMEAGFVGVRQQAKLGLAPFLLTVGIARKTAVAVEATQPTALAA